MSLIISSKFRATLSILFPAVMATSPVADARTASPAPEEARPTEETVAENLLMAEMDSLVKMMADVSKIPEENKGTLHFVPESDDTDPARAQLDVLVKIQHSLVQQQTNQEAALKSQLAMCKMADSLGRLLSEQSRSFEKQKKEMLQYMEKESNMHQNSMDQVETVVSKVGESLRALKDLPTQLVPSPRRSKISVLINAPRTINKMICNARCIMNSKASKICAITCVLTRSTRAKS